MCEPVQVAVGVVQRGDGRVLVARRDPWRHQGGGLEFPGGKVEPGESIAEALERELLEELGIRPLASSAFMSITHRYSDRSVALHVRRVTEWSGEEALAGVAEDCTWREPAALDHRDFPAANRPVIAALRWPAYSPVTPSLAGDGEAGLPPSWRAAVEGALSADRARMLRVRLSSGASAAQPLIEWLRGREPRHPATRLLVNGVARQVGALPPWVGLHLSAQDAAHMGARPVSEQRLLSCACHSAAEIEHAEALGADVAYVGPVKATPSHPGATPLGWAGFGQLAARTHLPLYAIGGLSGADLGEARAAGALGVAGIRGFWPV